MIETNGSSCKMCVSADEYIVSARLVKGRKRDNGFIFWWDPNAGEELRSSEFNERISTVACSPNEDLIAVGFDNGNIVVIDPLTQKLLANCGPHVQQLCFVPDRSKLISASPVSVALWNLERGDMVWERKGGLQTYCLS